MYLFFYMALGINDFDGENSLLGPSENLDFFGPKWHSLCLMPFQGPKKSQFSGPASSNGPRNELAPIKIISPAPHKQQVH
jgi:hypothetical protein